MSKPRILIADDEAHIRIVVGSKLEAAGYEVVAAIDGQEAYELALEAPPELLITDLQMPRMTGLELCMKLRAVASTVPVIMLTSRGDILEDAQKVAAGILHILDKPFSPRQLANLVGTILPANSMAA